MSVMQAFSTGGEGASRRLCLAAMGLGLSLTWGEQAHAGGDCVSPVTQSDMNICAQRDFDAADASLNQQWKLARKTMAETDKNLSDDLKGAEAALVRAQRAWLEFRDAQCESDGFSVRGGSMEPLIVLSCKAELTKTRTRQLKTMLDHM